MIRGFCRKDIEERKAALRAVNEQQFRVNKQRVAADGAGSAVGDRRVSDLARPGLIDALRSLVYPNRGCVDGPNKRERFADI